MSPTSMALDFIKARRESGLSDETMEVLLHLQKVGDATKQEIACACRINATTLPRYLARLVTSGHLEKEVGGDDKRERIFHLNAHGVRLVKSLLKHFPSTSRVQA